MSFCVVLVTIGEQEDSCRGLFHGRSRMSAVAIVLFACAVAVVWAAPSAYNDTSAYAARRDPRRGESPMMCASAVQVATLPGEVVSNTGD